MKTLLALNTDLSATPATAGQAPEWVELIPAGPIVTGRDGRTWLFDELAGSLVLNAFQARGVDVAIDWEHASERLAPIGQPAPAAGWVDQLEIRDGALWGHVSWTPRAAEQVASREYRFLSPVFDYDTTFSRITLLVSVGLVNKPNLFLTALNNETQEQPVTLSAALRLALGLPETATEADAIAAATALNAKATAINSEQPNNLERFVPRADFDTASARALNAEQQLASLKKAGHDKAVGDAIDAALQAGKITPATVEYHRACCAEEGGLERFHQFVAAAPEVAGAASLPGKPASETATALNAEQQAVCAQFGMDPVEFAKSLKNEG